MRFADRLEDRVLVVKRVTREVHLRHEPAREGATEDGEMDVRRAPRVRMVLPRIGTGLHCDEFIAAVRGGERATRTREVGIERRWMLVALVPVPSGRVRLPDLDERARDGPSVLLEQAAGHDDSLAKRFAAMLPRQVVVELADLPFPVEGVREVVDATGQDDEWPCGNTPRRRPVVRVVERRVDVLDDAHRRIVADAAGPRLASRRPASSRTHVGSGVARPPGARVSRDVPPEGAFALLGHGRCLVVPARRPQRYRSRARPTRFRGPRTRDDEPASRWE